MRSKLDKAQSNRWPDLLAGADQRISEIEDEMRTLTNRHAVELATAEFRGGEDDLLELDAWAEQGLAILGRLWARRDRLIGIAAATRGLDGRDVWSDQGLDELTKALNAHGDRRPPRIPTLTPLVDEQPLKVYRVRGDWGRTTHNDQIAEDQPAKLEPVR